MRALFVPMAMTLLAACQSELPPADTLDSLEAELFEGQSANATDPAILAALAEPILVDPMLSASANADMVRPPAQPFAAAIPHPAVAAGRLAPLPADTPPPATSGSAARDALTLDALLAALGSAARRCVAPGLDHSTIWATRLPEALPLYPDARLSEAAGRDAPGCSLRATNYFADLPAGALTGWYRQRSRGFTLEEAADGPTRILSGRNGTAAFRLYVTQRSDGGSDVDLVYAAAS